MRPFFSYYGSKYNLARHYPRPQFDVVNEPFAGSACYSLFWESPIALLRDISPYVSAVWEWLIKVTREEFLSLPTGFIEDLDELKLPQEQRWYLGFWQGRASIAPRRCSSSWVEQRHREQPHGGDVFGETTRLRLANQLDGIRRWKVVTNYTDEPATWFIDPPYDNKAGRHYKTPPIDYTQLGEWCKTRPGQVIVCENKGATWLPFTDVKEHRGQQYNRVESMYYQESAGVHL